MKFIKYFLSFAGIVICVSLLAQVPYSETRFGSPLGIDLVLAGNFSEIRPNHFHTGLDIKTNGREGYKIYAIDSGYISRINISHYGYGNAVYITHPNGYTSVYAHLSTFPDEVLDYVRKVQYANKSEVIQVFPNPMELPLKKGQVFAYSGNSGSSSAPHLHFEIRETATENPINPLLFNFPIKDDVKPALLDVKVYPLEGALVKGKSESFNISLKGSDGIYAPSGNDIIDFEGKIGLSINTIDYLNDARNKCGIYLIQLLVDDKLVFKQKMERLKFSENRYSNTHADYLEYRFNKQSYHKSFRAENNKLDIYELINGDGGFSFNDTLIHRFKYLVSDTYGNTSVASFTLKSNGLNKKPFVPLSGLGVIDASSETIIREDGFEAILPKYSVYEDLKYLYKKEAENDTYAPIHVFHNDRIPIQQYFVLKLKTANIPQGLEDKALVVEMSSSRKSASAKGGTYLDGWMETKLREFGDYSVKIDSVPPVVKPVNFEEGKNIQGLTSIVFKMWDNLSGIETYDMYIDDQWILSYYDTGKGTLTLPFDKYNLVSTGAHVLKVVVTDERKNKNEQTFNFTK